MPEIIINKRKVNLTEKESIRRCRGSAPNHSPVRACRSDYSNVSWRTLRKTPELSQTVFDGLGQKVVEISNGGAAVRHSVYDAFGKLVAEYDTNISQTAQRSYILLDKQGSTRVVTNAQGTVIARHWQ